MALLEPLNPPPPSSDSRALCTGLIFMIFPAVGVKNRKKLKTKQVAAPCCCMPFRKPHNEIMIPDLFLVR